MNLAKRAIHLVPGGLLAFGFDRLFRVLGIATSFIQQRANLARSGGQLGFVLREEPLRILIASLGCGNIGAIVADRALGLKMKVIAYDPFVSQETGRELGVEMVSLEEVFRRADVVSLHTPWLESTVGMITGAHFAMMKSGASFINTSRGAVVREEEMIEALKLRPDLFAVIDVTWPEPPAVDSPLFTLRNVFLTQHIAGSMDMECRRMGRYMLDELRHYLAGEPLQYEITRERAALLA